MMLLPQQSKPADRSAFQLPGVRDAIVPSVKPHPAVGPSCEDYPPNPCPNTAYFLKVVKENCSQYKGSDFCVCASQYSNACYHH